ncbi:MAG TPA: hypothetical protein PK082_09510 [Phycisphaerae bacterium]|nr:hypothetical protein [Phycisphaerae bacterium]
MRGIQRLVIAGLVLSAWAAAQAAGPVVHTAYQPLFNAAQQSGRPVFIVFMPLTAGEVTMSSRNYMLHSPSSKQIIHALYEVAEIQIQDSDARYVDYRRKIKGNFVPFWVVATPEGEYLAGGDGDTVGRSFTKDRRRDIAAIGARYPILSKADREKFQASLTEAQKNFAEGAYKRAAATAAKILKVAWWPKQLRDDCQKLLDDIVDQGKKGLEAANGLLEQKKVFEAAVAYDRIVDAYSYELSTSKEAKKLLVDLYGKYGDLSRRVNEHKAEQEAAELLKQAEQLEKDGKLREAQSIYLRLVSGYRSTTSYVPAAKGRDRIMEELKKQSGAGESTSASSAPSSAPASSAAPDAADAEKEARLLLQLAKNYRAAGMKDKSDAALVECVKKYPRTEAGQEALRLTVEWKVDLPKDWASPGGS